MKAPDNPLIMLGPTILCVFAGCFYLFWLSDKGQRHLLFFAISSALFCIGSLMQMLSIPSSYGLNAVITAFIYTLSVLMLCDGLLKRKGMSLSIVFYVTSLTLLVGGIIYFFYVERNLQIRIYILNFGLGSIFLYSLRRLKKLRLGTAPDRYLFWLLLAFALQFFIRTAFTINQIPLIDLNFGKSVFWLALQYSLAVFGVALALALLAVIVHDKLMVLEKESLLDPLTGLHNRRGFDKQADAVFENRHERSMSIMLIDIDHFKSINDSFGHACGDDVLRKVGVLLKNFIRQRDISARIGGEEFIILMPDTSLMEAQERAQQVCTLIAENNYEMPEKRKVTVSIGVASAYKNESLYSLIHRADQLLYRAKNAGRNQVIVDYNDPAVLERQQ